MSERENSLPCLAVCWTLGGLVGIGLAVAVSVATPAIVAAVIGAVAAVAVAVFLQVTLCGLNWDHWGPFEGLKGVPGWDADQDVGEASASVQLGPPRTRPARTVPPSPSSDAALTNKYDALGPATEEGKEAAGENEKKPELLVAPRAGGADDLKRINGVGPKLEETLNALGIHHFDQIAAWTPENAAWINGRLKSKGRIDRDNWIGQARSLAADRPNGRS